MLNKHGVFFKCNFSSFAICSFCCTNCLIGNNFKNKFRICFQKRTVFREHNTMRYKRKEMIRNLWFSNSRCCIKSQLHNAVREVKETVVSGTGIDESTLPAEVTGKASSVQKGKRGENLCEDKMSVVFNYCREIKTCS